MYIDGFVVPVKTSQRDAYRKMAAEAAEVWKEHGATSIVEAWGDDVPDGKHTSFPMAVRLEPDETVVFSWILWPSREARDDGNQKAMADPRMHPDGRTMPFSMERIIFGGFTPIVEA